MLTICTFVTKKKKNIYCILWGKEWPEAQFKFLQHGASFVMYTVYWYGTNIMHYWWIIVLKPWWLMLNVIPFFFFYSVSKITIKCFFFFFLVFVVFHSEFISLFYINFVRFKWKKWCWKWNVIHHMKSTGHLFRLLACSELHFMDE